MDLMDDAGVTALIVKAFSACPAKDWEMKAIRALISHPGSTCAQLGARVGWQATAWDMQIGRICNGRGLNASNMPPAALDGVGKPIRSIASFNASDRTWTMKPAALTAFQQLGIG